MISLVLSGHIVTFKEIVEVQYICHQTVISILCWLWFFPSLQIQALLATIRRILDAISDFSLVYVHHPHLLKFFLRYPELMGRFGHHILQLWFFCEDYSQIESENAVTSGATDLSDSTNNFRSLLCMLKGNPNALLILLVCSWLLSLL